MCVLITVRLIDMKLVNEFIDFHENRHKIIRKSIYHRKYHICNSISSICTTIETVYLSSSESVKNSISSISAGSLMR